MRKETSLHSLKNRWQKIDGKEKFNKMDEFHKYISYNNFFGNKQIT